MVAAVAAIACGAALRPAAAAYTYTTVGNPAIAGGYAYALNNSGQVATTSLVTSHFFNDPSTYASPVFRRGAASGAQHRRGIGEFGHDTM